MHPFIRNIRTKMFIAIPPYSAVKQQECTQFERQHGYPEGPM